LLVVDASLKFDLKSPYATRRSVVSNPKALIVEVLHNKDIAIADPDLAFKVTYRRDGNMLAAIEWVRGTPSRAETNFLVVAWRAAYAKAQQLGWLRGEEIAA
jgi:hypothetical protein